MGKSKNSFSDTFADVAHKWV